MQLYVSYGISTPMPPMIPEAVFGCTKYGNNELQCLLLHVLPAETYILFLGAQNNA